MITLTAAFLAASLHSETVQCFSYEISSEKVTKTLSFEATGTSVDIKSRGDIVYLIVHGETIIMRIIEDNESCKIIKSKSN